MSQVAISALTALGAQPATNDLLVVVDVSDTSQAPTGTTKKMTTANLLTAPAITGAATISGSLAITGTLSVSGIISANDTIESSKAGAILNRTGASTAASYISLANTTGVSVFGVESAAGGSIFAGTAAYTTVFGTATTRGVQIVSNNVVALSIASTQIATFAAKVVVAAGGMEINGAVGIGTATPTTSTLLDLTSTTGALLLPRMTTTQRDALTPTNGMLIYNSTSASFNKYQAGSWQAF